MPRLLAPRHTTARHRSAWVAPIPLPSRRIGLRVGSLIAEGEFERALVFCGTGIIADAYLGASLGSGYEWWKNFYEFHKLAIDELEAFDYAEFKANGFKLKHLGEVPLELETKPE